MAVVGLYCVPQSTKDPFSVFVRERIVPRLRFYTNFTSQWQQWNLFSPDPLLRVTGFHVERYTGLGWERLREMSLPRSSFLKQVDHFKILDRISADGEDMRRAREHYLLSYCEPLRIAAGVRLRLTSDYYDVPRQPMSIAQWRSWKPTVITNERSTTTVTCPTH